MPQTDAMPAAVVMAASRGLGFASAAALAANGHPVAISGRSDEDVRGAAKRLGEFGPALGVACDVSNRDDLVGMIRQARNELGPVGVLVANAGGPPAGDFDAVPEGAWESAFRLTLMSFVVAVQEVLGDMRRAGGGRIVVIGSSSVRRPIPNLALSNTFRPALNGLVKDLAVSLARENITVNLVAPGRIDTDRVRDLDIKAAERTGSTPERVREQSEAGIPMARYGRPEELGALVGFLASSAASYITGQSILVDGGHVATLP